MKFTVLTIFPHILDSYVHESILGRAQTKKIIEVHAVNLRDFSKERHKKVDDRPYGGGAGMVLQVEPIARAVSKLISAKFTSSDQKLKNLKTSKFKTRVILFSTRGKKLDQKMAKRLSKYDELVFICGRYEGVDERVATHIADEEISVGDYILSGGELAALVTIDAVARQMKGVLGKQESLEEIQGSYPVYTRPPIVKIGKKKIPVPRVLLSGNHKEITEWRKKHHG